MLRRSGQPSGQGNGRPVRPTPGCPELAIVGPDPQSLVASAEDRDTAIGPIRLLVRVLGEPIEYVQPEGAFLPDRKWLHTEPVQQVAEALTLGSIRQVK